MQEQEAKSLTKQGSKQKLNYISSELLYRKQQ